jgi:methylenetetrahydrofolate dehydrogenase (NADP+)/methenyltetrahydrofolate cyclohydrolase
MILMDSKQVSSEILDGVRTEIEKLKVHGVQIGLALIIVGNNQSSVQYFSAIRRACKKVGITDYPYQLPDDTSINEILKLIKDLNNDERISGILVFLPLPKQLDARKVLNAVALEKDVDGLGAISIGRLAAEESTPQLFLPSPNFSLGSTFLPCTPYGVIKLLDYYRIDPKGKDVVIVGKSLTVGKSLALMMLAREATVTVCHRATKDLSAKTKNADILCVAAGKPKLITADMVKDGVVIIDIGINVLSDGRVVGDVDFEGVSKKASYYTPVPGGVGPVTIAILLKNTVTSARRMLGIEIG